MINGTNDIRKWVIYKITSPSGRQYIGKSQNYKSRIVSYKSLRCNSQPLLYNSFKKYGFDSHKIDVIDTFEGDNRYASGKEIFWIRSCMTHRHKFPNLRGMNMTDGGEGQLGKVASELTRMKQSLAKKGKPPHNKGKKGIQSAWNKGIKGGCPAWNKGVTYSHLSEKERKEKFGKHNVGNSYNKGRVHNPGYAENIRKRMIGVENFKLMKPINQYNSNHELIASFSCQKEAVKKTRFSKSTVFSLIKSGTPGKRTKCYFKYA